jgi:LPS-assembly protein
VICRFIFLTILSLTATLAHSQELELTSEIGDFDGRTNERVLRGNARITDGVTLITADEIRHNLTTQTITATGRVVFTRRDIRLLADKLVLDQKTQNFTAERVRFGVHPYYAEGESASGSLAEITLNRATVTYGEPGPWQPTFRADKIIYAPGQRLRTENAQAGIGHTQPFPFPRLQQDLKEPFVSFATFNGGYRSSLGVFAEAGLHLPTAAGVRLGGELGLYSARGVMFGPSGSYGSRADPDLRGYFRTGYINDHGDKKTDILGRPVPENRGYVEWQHEQKLADHLSLSAQLNWWKDSEILRDFRPRSFFPVQAPDTFVESAYAGPNYFVSLFARFQPNSFQRVQERLPELRFDLLPLALGNGFVERFNASVAVLRETQVADIPPANRAVPIDLGILPPKEYSPAVFRFFRDGPEYRTNRLDAYYSLSRPVHLSKTGSRSPIRWRTSHSLLTDS